MSRTEDYSAEIAFSVEDIISEYRYGTAGLDIETDTSPLTESSESEHEEADQLISEEKNISTPEKKSFGIRNPFNGAGFSALKDKFLKGRSDISEDFTVDYREPVKRARADAFSDDSLSYGVKSEKLQLDDLRKEIENEDIDLSQFDAYYTVNRNTADNEDSGNDFYDRTEDFVRSSYIDLAKEDVSSPAVEIEVDADAIMSSEDDSSVQAAEASLPVQAQDYSAENTETASSAVSKLFSGFTSKVGKRKEIEEDYLDDDAEDGYGRYSEDDKRFSSSDFKSYLATVSANISYKLLGMGEAFFTQEEDKEELGEEVSFKAAQKHYYRHSSPLGARLKISTALIIIMTWISIGLPVSGMLKSNKTATAVCLGFQLLIMLLSLDIITNAITKAFRKIIGFDTLAVLACIVTALDAILVTSSKAPANHLSLCFVSSLSLYGLQVSSYLFSRALWKSIRVPGISHKDSSYTVTAEYSEKTHDISLLKSEKPFKNFIRRSEEKSPDEDMYGKISIFIIIAVVLLTLVLTAAKKDFRDIFYFFSLILCPAVPFCGLLCFAVPFFAGAFKMFPKAAAVAGWSGVYDIGHSKNMIITGKDLFPSDHIEITDIKIAANTDVNKTIAYAGSLMLASGNCLARPFCDYMQNFGIRTCIVNDFKPLEGGGFKGIIDQQVIYCGSSDFMRLQGIKVPTRKIKRTSVLLAVNNKISAVFDIEYKASPEIREALLTLLSSSHHPVFAVKDFNITPEMLHELFDVPTDGYDFPPFEQRFSISVPKEDSCSSIAAVVCREGLSSFVEMTSTVSKIYKTTRFNMGITIIGSLISALAVFFIMLITGSVSTLMLFVIAAVLAAPVLIISLLIKF